MGNQLSSLLQNLFSNLSRLLGKKECRILMVGLDSAGKTTILYKLRLGEVVTTIPTVGFNVETVVYNNISFTMWDIGGQKRIRQLWRHYYHGADAIIFVLDSSDHERVGEAAEELEGLMASDELKGAALLIFLNKSDMPNIMNTQFVEDALRLDRYRASRTVILQKSCATTGDGIFEGLAELSKVLTK